MFLRRLRPLQTSLRTFSNASPASSTAAVNVDFLKKITEKHKAEGRTFLLPFGDSEAIERILEPIRQLNVEGVKLEFLQDALCSDPNIFREFSKQGTAVVNVLDLLVGYCGFSLEDALRHIDNLHGEDPDEINRRLSVFTAFGILAGRQLGHVVKKSPQILWAADSTRMASTIEGVSSFFSRTELNTLLLQAPHFSLIPFEELEQKYEYIYFHMRIESTALVESLNWMNLSLEEIMERHEFLVKTGKYKLPDPKRPQFEKENPAPYLIFDLDHRHFAPQVGGVSIEEWNAFRVLAEKKRLLEKRDKPFERIKPSVRKAFERRLKRREEIDGALDF